MMDEELLEGDPNPLTSLKSGAVDLARPFQRQLWMPTALLSPSERNKLGLNRHNVGEYRWAFLLHL